MTSTRGLQGKVIQGEKMAAVGLLAGNVAHELNNPLTGIHSLSDLLLQDLPAESNTAKDLAEVRDAAKRCQRIIRDLLEFTDMGDRKAYDLVDINELIRRTLPLLKMAMRNHNCKNQLEDKSILVKCNPQLFQQVIFNLVNNACQAMAEGGDLQVTTLSHGRKSYVIIKDNGPGIPEEFRQAIFDPFFTTKEKGKGTGLGLSMSRSVIERYGGQLTLNPSTDKGCEFIIELPLAEESQ